MALISGQRGPDCAVVLWVKSAYGAERALLLIVAVLECLSQHLLWDFVINFELFTQLLLNID